MSGPGADDPRERRPDPEAGLEAERERRAREKFIADLLARGQAVFEGEEPTTRTTHIIVREEDGTLTVRRLRFH
ncbi:hypothetical protein [Streptomyces aidingensis]|uniref:Uncharacterized protein n=1 Tax=Streptomyces aidingensis TaxID=910347 RepID=A0A1I1PDE7_9ACTN|nr:hypothetical protein [Streptomyces aidingensis]SFD07829.1 hypothetical protein SAMN05421773_109119 [Streptomyces aidingensis]